MLNLPNRQLTPWLTFLGALLAVLYYAFLYRPLSQTARSLDKPLAGLWQDATPANGEPGFGEGLGFEEIREKLRQAKQSQTAFEKARRILMGRLDLEPGIRSRMEEPFQLIDYQNERQLRLDQITRFAAQQQVRLDAAVESGFAKHTAEHPQPALLWAQLAILHEALMAAIACQPSAIKSVHLPPTEPQPPADDKQPVLEEIRAGLELTGSMTSVSRFLLSLPLRAEEMKALTLPEAPRSKPALFIERVMLRKQSPDKPDEVRLNLLFCGFVAHAVRKQTTTDSPDPWE